MSGRPRSERAWRSQRGQSTLEYAGLLVLVAVVIAVVMPLGLGSAIGRAVRCEVGRVLRQTGICHGTAASRPPGGRPAGLLVASAPADQNSVMEPASGSARPPQKKPKGWKPKSAPTPSPGRDPSRGPKGGRNNTGPPNATRGAQWKRLPRSGPRAFKGNPKKGWPNREPAKTSTPKGYGYEDEYGNVWVWDKMHQDHWDVETQVEPGVWVHTNVYPNGEVRGDDNMNGPSDTTPPTRGGGRGSGEGEGGGVGGEGGDPGVGDPGMEGGFGAGGGPDL